MSSRRPVKNDNIGIFLLTLGISFVLVGAPGYADVKVKGKKRDIQETQRPLGQEDVQTALPMEPPVQDEVELPDRYESLLVKYLANIDRIRHEQQETAVRRYQKGLRRLPERAKRLEEREAEILSELFKEAKTRSSGMIDFEGHCYETSMGIVIPTSNTSARILTTLYRSKVLNAEYMMQRLHGKAQILSEEWLDLIKEIVANTEVKQSLRDTCIKTLYRAGVSREMYRAVLRKMAEQNHDVSALEALFFRVDPESGELTKVVTYDNLTLMKALSQPDQPPQIQVACAHYAAKIHDYALAESVCIRLLEQPYQGHVQRVSGGVPADRPLFAARRAAMRLMFYGIRNEKCFETVHARSRIHITEAEQHRPDEGGWASFRSYVLGDMEVEEANSYISIIKKQKEG